MARAVCSINLRDLRHQRVVRVGVREQRADRQQHLRDGQRGAPLVFQDVQADAAVGVDVAVIDARREVHLGRLERVVGREVDVQEVHAAGVRAVLGAHDGRLPVEQVVAHGAGAAVSGRVAAQVLQLLVDPL